MQLLVDPFGLAQFGKSIYTIQTGKDIGITTPSLAFEAWMHADYYSKGLAIEQSHIADCGKHDADRWFWDTRTFGIPDDRQAFYDAMKDIIK